MGLADELENGNFCLEHFSNRVSSAKACKI
jgi:hypothetical protein